MLAVDASSMERSVQSIVVGGLVLVAGLWILEFVAGQSVPWALGLAAVFAGVCSLAVGIARDLTVGPLDRV